MENDSSASPPDGPPNIELGRQVRAHRKRLGLNQTAYGKRYGVNQVTVSKWETGIFRPDDEHMKKLKADFLKTDERECQLSLPFEQTFVLELRIGPQRAGSVDVRVQLKELAN
jgi:transcriptional regulator with XRE-family HTH domain